MMTEFQTRYWVNDRHQRYHQRQYATPFHSTIALRQFAAEIVGDVDYPFRALDVCCGAGANIFHLSQWFTRTSWVGVDLNAALFPLAQQLIKDSGGVPDAAKIEFILGDCYQLSDYLPLHAFDLVFSIQTLSWLPAYEEALAQLLAMVKPNGYLFITSLFTDCLLDAQIQITQYATDQFEDGEGPLFYNIYCYDRFRARCLHLGADQVIATDFILDDDIPPPAHRQLGTFTRRLADGSTLQCSGPLLLPWKFLAVHLPASMGACHDGNANSADADYPA